MRSSPGPSAPASPGSATGAASCRGGEAVRHLNEAAARTPAVPVLDWPEDIAPVVRQTSVRAGDDLGAALAHAVIALLASPDLDRLRVCHAPRRVRYFLEDHPRQEWCTPRCGNRARVTRHRKRHKAPA
ncbi:CGNR zinc finger domain-containing protein [Streptomyces qaidamensis]|uniref:CGNR zinc finger domain-containing protein n=1 Tax=Streptomyces qaidamensis TaxID=1783515 RepID=UPI0036658816